MLGARRLLVALVTATVLGSLFSHSFTTTPTPQLILRELVVGLGALFAFGLFERWPAQLPRWLARWALQVIAVALAIPLTVAMIYAVITYGDEIPFWSNELRQTGFLTMTVSGMLIAPWIAMSALLRERDRVLLGQAVAFERERGELERTALDARLRLLQAQVEPHFLFNTLANVRELVDSGSPQASSVLGSLIAYLRAAVPRLHDPATTLGQELQLVRAYLELMHMRMPDRLAFDVTADAAASKLRCPPMSLLTLVENAVRHGVDPSEEGGRIDVRVRVENGRCRVQVSDTGVGLQVGATGLGTGLSTLRERLALSFGGDAQLTLTELEPHGVRAELEFPALASRP
jgi:sensor histidine kinase YesM